MFGLNIIDFRPPLGVRKSWSIAEQFPYTNGWAPYGASLLSFVPTYMTNGHHRKDGKCSEGKEPIDFVTRTEAKGVSRLSGGDLLEPKRR